MGDLYVARAPHHCPTPIRGQRNLLCNIATRPPGSVWQCDECAEIWQAIPTLLGPQWIRANEEIRERYARAARQVTG